jgi:hypothetical protein
MNFQHSSNPLEAFEIKCRKKFTSQHQKRSTRHSKTDIEDNALRSQKVTYMNEFLTVSTESAEQQRKAHHCQVQEWTSNHLRCNTYQ